MSQPEDQRLIQAVEDMKACIMVEDFLRVSSRVDQWLKAQEFNFAAEILMFVDMARHGQPLKPEVIERCGEELMMQLAFVDLGEQPPCSYIMACHAAGWRYRIDKGFHRI